MNSQHNLRYSRTLCERSPHVRSSQVQIEPMAHEQRTTKADLALYIVGVIAIPLSIVFNNWAA